MSPGLQCSSAMLHTVLRSLSIVSDELKKEINNDEKNESNIEELEKKLHVMPASLSVSLYFIN